MEIYKIIISIPSNKNFWEANKEERYIEAQDFDDMIKKALTKEEIQQGVRVIRIEHKLKDRYASWEYLKY